MSHAYLPEFMVIAFLASIWVLSLLSPPRRRPQLAAAGGASAGGERRARPRGTPDLAAPVALHVSGLYEADLADVVLPEEIDISDEAIVPEQTVRPSVLAASVAPCRRMGWQSHVLFFGLLTVLYAVDRFWALSRTFLWLIPSRKLRTWVRGSWRRAAQFGRWQLDR